MRKAAIVLLPGLDGTGSLFGPLLDCLPSHLRTIVVAYPGNQKLGYAALLETVMHRLPAEEPVVLGESFSGPLALMAAAKGPRHLKGLVLCATFVRSPLWIRAAWLHHLVPDFAFRLYPQFSAAKALLGRYSTPELRASFQSALATVRPEVLAHRVREVLQVDVSEELSRCPVPILYLRGSRDLIVPRHNFHEMARLSPAISEATLAAPHMIVQTKPDEAADAISRFIERLVDV
jgi:pimeloyl-[acyl-carrier protein] methyl ester esterase